MLGIGEIQEFFEGKNYDIRLHRNARWIDQKCTADVMTIVSDCISQFVGESTDLVFTSKEIWHADYTVQNVEAIFKKPGVSDLSAQNEYDKYFQQPMELLSYAGVLAKSKVGRKNVYKVRDKEVLNFIALRDRNALAFIQFYVKKVLLDSGLEPAFDKFFLEQTANSYFSLKSTFEHFIIRHTKINKVVECRRIFTKVLNPIAYLYDAKGTSRGNISKHKITYDMLMYNRVNFRDLGSQKPKGMTRQEYISQLSKKRPPHYAKYASQKAKRVVRDFNEKFRKGRTEVLDPMQIDQAIHIHHIFPEAEFTEICDQHENLIALTPTQHLSFAHPGGHTAKIDLQFQHVCLLAKAANIEETLMNEAFDQIYDFGRFMHVLSVGLDDDNFESIAEGDFVSAIAAINRAYAS